jgi:hypothetical protein
MVRDRIPDSRRKVQCRLEFRGERLSARCVHHEKGDRIGFIHASSTPRSAINAKRVCLALMQKPEEFSINAKKSH